MRTSAIFRPLLRVIMLILLRADSNAEKITRATLKSAAVRLITRKAFVILDSLNYFKSFRYEMFRFAVEQGTTHCVVRVWRTSERCSACLTDWPHRCGSMFPRTQLERGTQLGRAATRTKCGLYAPGLRMPHALTSTLFRRLGSWTCGDGSKHLMNGLDGMLRCSALLIPLLRAMTVKTTMATMASNLSQKGLRMC